MTTSRNTNDLTTDAITALTDMPHYDEPTDAERAMLTELTWPRQLLDAKVHASNPASREFIVRCSVFVEGRGTREYSTHHAVIWSHTRDGQPSMAWGNYMLDALTSFADFLRR